ncbi:MAG TPA: M81 family metallopeptidase, partial [Clostridia bacterium]|nr:M81 family metallopeptidase [Clostridia bacterium]
EDFVYFEGGEILKHLYVTEVFKEAQIIPLIYATALPNGVASRDTYDYYADRILKILSENKDVDGVFLHLHGSLAVQGLGPDGDLGSGEYDLIKRIRKLIGSDPIIGLALDTHANTDPRLPKLVNVMRNYRTVPHQDQDVTEQVVARHMIDCIKNKKKTVPQFVRLPYAIHPEKALGREWPLSEIFARLDEMEKMEGVSVATLGIGMIWCDCETLASNVAVTPSEDRYTRKAAELARELADYVYSFRDSFEFSQLPLSPYEAVKQSIDYKGSPVFVSDSGDNTTGGAVGDHTILLREFLNSPDYKGKRIAVTGIWDEKAVARCMKHNEGDVISIKIGRNYDDNTKAVAVTGTLKKKGHLYGFIGHEKDAVGAAVTISIGYLDIVLIDRPGSFITIGHFKGSGLDIEDYDVIVVKQGYLFQELRELAKLAILALTPGATNQIIEDLEYKRIVPPVYPLKKLGI